MADIDKGLPNTRTQVKVPGEEVEIKEEIKEQAPVEVIPEEDGGATIDFEPGAINIPGTEKHFDNLADILPDDVLEPLGSEMKQNYMDYKMSRKEWERSYTEGLDLLGFNTKIERSRFKELQVPRTLCWQKLLHSFKPQHTKSYYQQTDQ